MQNKKLFGASAAYILGLKPDLKIKGNSDKLSVYKDVLESSKSLYESLENKDSLEEVEKKILSKKEAAKRFKRVLGLEWPF
jgi:KaiC/GvpD/RAD55 family RecA-like ATPase